MNHADHINLLRGGVPSPGGVWADLGSGEGAFTLALAELLGPAGQIYSVDRDGRALSAQRRRLAAAFPGVAVHQRQHDYTTRLELPPLDGLVMANALHFQRHKEPILGLLLSYLRPGGHLILVEYNVDRGNLWVPHPLSYPTWEALAARCGFAGTRLLARRPSSFLGEIYSALSVRPETEA